MMGLEGIPAFYIHSLLATPNDVNAVERSGQNRSINRHTWDYTDLQGVLNDDLSDHNLVFHELIRRLNIRRRQPAFHPNATQFTLQLGDPFFAFWRQSRDRSQSIFALHNMTAVAQELRLADLNLISLDRWQDPISEIYFDELTATVTIEPYQCLWIMNVRN
ncbi:MAG: alpha-amylase, partial [Fuerstiella sp.]